MKISVRRAVAAPVLACLMAGTSAVIASPPAQADHDTAATNDQAAASA